MLVSCWAQYRYIPGTWSAPSMSLSDIEDMDKSGNVHLNSINENDLLEKFLPISYRPKKFIRKLSHADNEDRKKKFLSEPLSSHDGDNLQGLWAMPGRR